MLDFFLENFSVEKKNDFGILNTSKNRERERCQIEIEIPFCVYNRYGKHSCFLRGRCLGL